MADRDSDYEMARAPAIVVSLVTSRSHHPRRRQSARPEAVPGETTRLAGDARRTRRRWWSVAALVGLALFFGILWTQLAGRTSSRAPTHRVAVVNVYPHDPQAYCQGLAYRGGFLYEGTGTYGGSSIRQVELETGKVVRQHNLADHLFGEGITLWQDELVQLTWKNRAAIVYDVETFRELRRHTYQGEGWGLTHDGRSLIMSDGTETLRFLDPRTFAVQRQLVVRDGNRRVGYLNELEYVEGEILANVWYDDRIVRISPRTGRVLGWIDLSSLYPRAERPDEDDVLNGIAYDEQQRRLFVTGKNWPRLYEIRVLR